MFTCQGSANESFLSGASPPTGVDLDYKKRNMVHSLSLREALIAFTGYFLMKGREGSVDQKFCAWSDILDVCIPSFDAADGLGRG